MLPKTYTNQLFLHQQNISQVFWLKGSARAYLDLFMACERITFDIFESSC